MGEARSGVLVVDKPGGVSSAGAVAEVKRCLRARKTGHAGTLDPMATGVLVCLVGRATRLAGFLLKGDKGYEAVLRLGEATDTQDSTGAVVASGDVGDLDEARIRGVFGRYTGTLRQRPPAYSALKHRGVPLYKLARQGRPVQKPARKITIFALDILDVDLPRVRFQVSCSGGTYIRTLCTDIGAALGCGGHLEALRRTESSGFDLDRAVTLAQLEAHKQTETLGQVMISMAESIPEMPVFHADSALAQKIAVGRPLNRQEMGPVDGAAEAATFARVIDDSGALLAVLETGDGTQFRYCCVFARDEVGRGP